MRTVILLVFGALTVSTVAGQVRTQDETRKAQVDPYHLAFVKSAFESFQTSERLGTTTGSQLKQYSYNFPSLSQLGDSVSVAVLKLYDLDELSKPKENTRAYLRLVSIGFSACRRLLDETDRKPRVTLLLLDYLEQKSEDTAVKMRIEKLKQCTSTCSCLITG